MIERRERLEMDTNDKRGCISLTLRVPRFPGCKREISLIPFFARRWGGLEYSFINQHRNGRESHAHALLLVPTFSSTLRLRMLLGVTWAGWHFNNSLQNKQVSTNTGRSSAA